MSADRSTMIDNYLLGNMQETEVESFEQRLMADDELFYEVADRENALVDRYVSGSLPDSIREQFVNSLTRFPERRTKIANASLLKEHISGVRASSQESPADKVPWYRRLGFAFQAPALATAALGLLLVGTIGLLFFKNQTLNQQIARLNFNGQNLNELHQREAELQAILEAERAAGSDLTTDLESERERRTALENELADLRKQIAGTRPPENKAPMVPTIATLILRPTGPRGGPSSIRTLRINNDEKRVALKIFLPADRPEGDVSVRINDIPAAGGIKPNPEPGGANSISVSVAAESFRNGLNRVEVFDSRSQGIVSFAVTCERGPVR